MEHKSVIWPGSNHRPKSISFTALKLMVLMEASYQKFEKSSKSGTALMLCGVTDPAIPQHKADYTTWHCEVLGKVGNQSQNASAMDTVRPAEGDTYPALIMKVSTTMSK